MRALMSLLLLAACTHEVDVYDRVTVLPARDLDILYVLDDSLDRGSYDQMASQLDVMLSKLSEVDGLMPNLHVGVVTTDLGTRGAKDALPGPAVSNCIGEGKAGRLMAFGAGIPPNGFLEDVRAPNGERNRNFGSDDLRLELGRLTNPPAGTANTGCEFEQPLQAMRRALDPDANPGFIRPGAMLSVVFLTTEDDCSFASSALLDPNDPMLGPLSSFRCTEQGVVCDEADPRTPGVRTNCRPRENSPLMVDVSEYQAFLEQYKQDKRDVVVSAVAGARNPFEVQNLGVPTLAPSCRGQGGNARPAVRIGSLVDSFGGAMVDGCTQENAYAQLTTPIVNRQRSCFANLTRADGEDCEVLELAGGMQTELQRCPATGTTAEPCWYTFTDEAACPAGENIGIAVRRSSAPPQSSRIQASCFVK